MARSAAFLAAGAFVAAGALVSSLACTGDSGPRGPAGPPGGGTTPTQYLPGEAVPRIVVTIEDLSGASGPGGEFRVGDRPSVRFRLTKEDGSAWLLDEMASGEALVSGPSFNYQRVLPLATDVISTAAARKDGSYVHSFASPIPATYLPPYNDSSSFGAEQGELAGQALLDGTYTVGLSFAWDYTVSGTAFRRVGEATIDFLVGTGAGALAPREVTRLDNCDQCHVELQAHDGRYRDLTLCLLCHTSGAEDANDPSIAGGTPGVAIDSRVLFHRIHTGRSLPSVLGVATNPDGSRDYAAAPVPLRFARPDGQVRDLSWVAWPVMPNRELPLPRDVGYSALPASLQVVEDLIRSGPATCFVCHGDPDGTGPLGMPAQGDLVFAQLSRKACGACHDDVDFNQPYTSNSPPPPASNTMPPQLDDSQCSDCHGPELDHLHPLRNDAFNEGIHANLLSVVEAGTNDGDCTFDPGEKIQVSLSFTDDFGATVPKRDVESVHAILSGPIESPQVLLDVEVPKPILIPLQPFVFRLPERRELELVGTSSAALSETFQTSATPIQDPGSTMVFVRTAAGSGSLLSAAAGRRQNYADVLDATPFQRDDYVVVDDGLSSEEYLRLQFVAGNRLWLSAPNQPAYPAGFVVAHAAGATIDVVALDAKTQGLDYALDPTTGTITELVEFGAGNAVIASYTTDFEVPVDYPAPANDSPDLDETSGEWTGKSLVGGTYALSLRATRLVDVDVFGEITTYRVSSKEDPAVLLFGSATAPEPYTLVSPTQNCAACHQDLTYHDGRYTGFVNCIVCHGASGLEDVPRYVAASAPATSATTVAFRTLLHRIHRGQKLAFPNAIVVGAGAGPYPDNFANHSYERVLFPAMPGDTMQCGKCHGYPNTAALFPRDRGHPTEQGSPVLAWRESCSGCHDSTLALGHMDLFTTSYGLETCALCHGPGEDEDVLLVHEPR